MDAYGCGHEMRKLFKRVLVYLFFYLNILFHNSAIDKKNIYIIHFITDVTERMR